MKRFDEALAEALAEARRPKPWWHSAMVVLFLLSWLTGIVGMYLGYRFSTTSPKVPGDGAIFAVNNHGDVRYLTEAQYYGSFGLLFGSVIVGVLCGVVLSILEGRKKKA